MGGSAFKTVYRTGGVRGLWQGASASIPRISVGSAAQLVTCTSVLDMLARRTSLQSGSWQANVAGAGLSGFMDCVMRILRTEGMSAFYKGLFAQYLRIGPHS